MYKRQALGVYERAGGAALYLEGQLTRGVMGTVGTHPLIFAYNSVETARFTGNSLLVTGSLDVQSGVTASSYTGSYYGDGSGITGIISSSYAVTASHALNSNPTALAISYFNVQNTSLADGATYYIGQQTTLQTSANAIAHIPLPAGTITEAYIVVYNASTFASGENITVNFLSDGGATSNTLSSTVTATSRHNEFIITGLSISINASRTFITIDCPTFTTNPTAVQFRVGIKLEL